jgi:hypothetical protein
LDTSKLPKDIGVLAKDFEKEGHMLDLLDLSAISPITVREGANDYAHAMARVVNRDDLASIASSATMDDMRGLFGMSEPALVEGFFGLPIQRPAPKSPVASKKRQRVVDDDDDDNDTTGSVISGPSHASLLPLPYHHEPITSAAMDMFLLHGAGSGSGSGAGSGSAGIITTPGTDYKQALQQLKRHARGANYEEAKNDLLRFAHSVETAGTSDALAALTGFFLDEPLPWDPQVRVRGV